MLKGNKKLKANPQYTSEMLYRHLELILKQMLRVWATETIAVRKISGLKSGNH